MTETLTAQHTRRWVYAWGTLAAMCTVFTAADVYRTWMVMPREMVLAAMVGVVLPTLLLLFAMQALVSPGLTILTNDGVTRAIAWMVICTTLIMSGYDVYWTVNTQLPGFVAAVVTGAAVLATVVAVRELATRGAGR